MQNLVSFRFNNINPIYHNVPSKTLTGKDFEDCKKPCVYVKNSTKRELNDEENNYEYEAVYNPIMIDNVDKLSKSCKNAVQYDEDLGQPVEGEVNCGIIYDDHDMVKNISYVLITQVYNLCPVCSKEIELPFLRIKSAQTPKGSIDIDQIVDIHKQCVSKFVKEAKIVSKNEYEIKMKDICDSI